MYVNDKYPLDNYGNLAGAESVSVSVVQHRS